MCRKLIIIKKTLEQKILANNNLLTIIFTAGDLSEYAKLNGNSDESLDDRDLQ